MKKLVLFVALMIATMMNLHATYYMAGNGSATNNWCCGIMWSPDGCEMNAGAYSTKVPAGTYEFKVTEGDWNVSYGYSSVDASASTPGYEGSDNVKFTVSAEANINVTFDGMYIVLTSDVPFGSATITSWTIAGDEAMMGSNWDPADTNNDMSLEGGVYKLVKKAYLTEGGFDYKACANHKWGVKEVPSSDNNTLQIDDDGDYIITFTLDAQGTTLSAVAKPDVPAPITLKFDMQGHGQQVEPQTIASGSKFEKPEDPQAEGFMFGGWFEEAACVNAFDFNKAVTADQETTIIIYAKWTEVKSVKKGQFETGDEDGFVMNEYIEATVSPEGTVTDGQLTFAGKIIISGNGSLIHGLKMVYENAYIQYQGEDIPKDGSQFAITPARTCTLSIAVLAPERMAGRKAKPSAKITSIEVLYEVLPPDTLNYLHFVGLKGGDSLTLLKNGPSTQTLNAKIEYSLDNRKSWTNYAWPVSTAKLIYGDTILLNANDTVWFRAGQDGVAGKNEVFSQQSDYYNIMCGKNDSLAVGGNIMSLLDASLEQDSVPANGVRSLFSRIGANLYAYNVQLPATKVGKNGYFTLFLSNTNLTHIPELPATVLGEACYGRMFMGCTKLEVDTISDLCNGTGTELIFPEEGGKDWNQQMFANCHTYDDVQLGGHYCVQEWKGPRHVTLTSVDSTHVYDGTPLTAESVVITGGLHRKFIQFSNFASQTEVGTCPNTFTYRLLKNLATEFTFDTIYGTLKVDYISTTPVAITIANLEKKYDGEVLEAEVAVEGLVGDDSLVIKLDTTYLVDAGLTAVKAVDFSVLRGEKIVTNGYIVRNIQPGSLKINPREITITSATNEKLYDGIALTNDTITFTGDGFVKADTVNITVTGTITDAGQCDNAFTYEFSGDKEDNYIITPEVGTLTVNKRQLTLTSSTASQPFDGTPLTKNEVRVSGDDWAEGEGATYNVTGTQTKVGNSANTFTYTFNSNTKADNYDITKIEGKLFVYCSIFPEIVGMYDKWNIVLNVNHLEDTLSNVGITARILPENVHWYIVNGEVDEADPLTGKVKDDQPANPATGFFHTENKAMSGHYYAVVIVPEALLTMGMGAFRSNVVFVENEAPKAPIRKQLINGQLIIEKDGAKFNAQGAKL